MNSLSLINCGFITVSAKERPTIAIREVLLDGKSIHQSASDNEIPYSTLRDYVKVPRLNESVNHAGRIILAPKRRGQDAAIVMHGAMKDAEM